MKGEKEKKNLKIAEIGFLVKGGALKTEGVGDVVDLDSTVLECLSLFLGGGVGT